jgi:hypothetical protein
MAKQETQRLQIPRWAWVFAGACFVIPVITLGGAIPGAIGGFSGAAVIAIARQTSKPRQQRLIHCGVITGSAWTVFVVFLFALTALQAKYPKLDPARAKHAQSESKMTMAKATAFDNVSSQEPEALTEEKRRDIYIMAMRTRSHIEFAKGNGASAEHLARLEQVHQRRLDFTARFHDITRKEVDEIVAEGHYNNWPRE